MKQGRDSKKKRRYGTALKEQGCQQLPLKVGVEEVLRKHTNLSHIKKMNSLTVFFFLPVSRFMCFWKMAFIKLQQKSQGEQCQAVIPPTVCFGHSSKSQRAYGSNIRSAGNKPVKAVCPFCSHVNKRQFLESYFGSATVREFRDFYPHRLPIALQRLTRIQMQERMRQK